MCLIILPGCGKTIRSQGTEQLVLSDAIDRVVRGMDFSPLAGKQAFLDNSYIKFKASSMASPEYIVSSLRNQLLAAGCQLVDSKSDAELIIEPRIGVLGSDSHEVTYGIPSSNLLSQAASLVPAAPAIPTIPEISLAKKNDQAGTAKLAVFCYDRETGAPVWQSGMAVARSSARDTWFAGIGPFQSGTIYAKPRFAGNRLRLPLIGTHQGDQRRQSVSHDEEFLFIEKEPEPEVATGDPAEGADDQAAEAEDGKVKEKPNPDKGG